MKKGKSNKPKIKAKPSEIKKTPDDEYTKEEIEKLDYFHDQTEHRFDDDEVYDLMLKYKDDDEAILNELNEQLKEKKRGAEFDWQAIGKSNLKYIFILFFYK